MVVRMTVVSSVLCNKNEGWYEHSLSRWASKIETMVGGGLMDG